MIEEALMNYGVAGLMLAYFITDKMFFQRNIQRVIENNTIALTRFYEAVKITKRKI